MYKELNFGILIFASFLFFMSGYVLGLGQNLGHITTVQEIVDKR